MQTKDMIYDALNGQICDEYIVGNGVLLKNLFGEGSECDELYEEAYAAKMRLNQRLGTEDDSDVECIFRNMGRVMHIIAMGMFDYGFVLGEKRGCESL